MAKRFTDTDKWKKPFIRGLQGAYKLLWFYILDDCDHAGVWHVDFDVAKIRIGEPVDQKTAIKVFGDRIEIFSDGTKWFLRDFIDFQYGQLSEKNRLHQSVLNILDKNNLAPYKPLPSGQGQGQGNGQGQGQDQGQGQGGENDFSDYEQWTESVKSGDDYLFTNMLKNQNLDLNGRLADFADSYLSLLAQYPNKKPSDQHRFRIALIGHIKEEIKKKPNVVQKPKWDLN